ncbi:MAG TPA: hypothetical protein VK986_00035, partial [Tepidisphaeraceae bacterium]|nr:hypothetical protein [Tepidisphaeraceae bacterium]
MPTPPLLAPTVEVAGDLFDPTSCRMSPDGSLLAFWVADSIPRTLFVAPTDQPSRVGDLAQPAYSTTDAHLADLAWSSAETHLAFTLTSGPPPGDVTIGVLRLADRQLTTLPGLAFAWLAPTLLIVANPATNRLYKRDVTTGHDQTVADLSDDGDPHFPPVLSVSPDGRRFMLVTRRIQDGWTRVQTGVRDGAGAWALRHLTDLPGVSIRVEPFWSADGASAALYIVDLERNHSAIVAVPEAEGEGQILYQSETVDAAVRPAAHPGTPLIAFVRAHPRDGSTVLTENRLVMLDPVNHAVTPLAPDP